MVVPSKKYCENHLHRGAKKAAVASSAAVTVVVAGGCSSNCKPEMVKKNYRVFDCDSTTSSSSDATTVSDENIYQFLSP